MHSDSEVACVVLAHNDPLQVGRLVRALDPFQVVLHCDRRAPRPVACAMKDAAGRSTQFFSEEHTAWGSWGLVSAELKGIEIALRTPSVEHVVVLSGTDYPIVPAEAIAQELKSRHDQSILHHFNLPQRIWGRSGGISRFDYWHKPLKKRMVRIPIKRAIPDGVIPAGGGAQRILCRRHAQEVLRIRDTRDDIIRYWRHVWVPDETFVPSVLTSPQLVARRDGDLVGANCWYIDWGGPHHKSPQWLTLNHLESIATAREARSSSGIKPMFARKFSSVVSSGLLACLDGQVQ
ncbi:MAG: beta-1,6-N-acetylglucosaminyltransferase [Acidimicrobiales bacterium]|jgi:hypothetical protein